MVSAAMQLLQPLIIFFPKSLIFRYTYIRIVITCLLHNFKYLKRIIDLLDIFLI